MPIGPDLGLYEALIDQLLARQLAEPVPGQVALRAKVEDVELPMILADHVGRHLAQALRAMPVNLAGNSLSHHGLRAVFRVNSS